MNLHIGVLGLAHITGCQSSFFDAGESQIEVKVRRVLAAGHATDQVRHNTAAATTE